MSTYYISYFNVETAWNSTKIFIGKNNANLMLVAVAFAFVEQFRITIIGLNKEFFIIHNIIFNIIAFCWFLVPIS